MRCGMNHRHLALLATAAALAGCSSTQVDRHTTTKYEKTPLAKVDHVTPEVAAERPHERIATGRMSTKGRMAKNLPAEARKLTAKLGGDAYVVTQGNTSTRMTGGLLGTWRDETVADMTFDVIRWRVAPAAATPPKPAKPGQPATATPAPEPEKKKKWYWPW
jgi:hypothetical protein